MSDDLREVLAEAQRGTTMVRCADVRGIMQKQISRAREARELAIEQFRWDDAKLHGFRMLAAKAMLADLLCKVPMFANPETVKATAIRNLASKGEKP